MSLTEELRKMALEEGINYFGVAPVSRWANGEDGYRPEDLLPDAKSVIVMGRRIPRGTVEANNRAYEGLRHGIFTYMRFGYDMVSDILEESALKIGRYLDETVGVKVFIPPSSVGRDEKKMVGMLSNRHAAVCAGLAEFGWNGLALTPDVGPRVRWVTIITAAELEYNSLYDGPEICTHCGNCVKICPLEALSGTEKVDLTIEGRTFSYGKLAKSLCRTAVSGLAAGSAGRLQADVKGKIHDSDDWYKVIKQDDKWNRMERVAAMCGRCMITCKAGNKTRACSEKSETQS